MANEKNLTPFEKGTSGNPLGKPKGIKNRSTIAKYWLEIEQEIENPLTGANEKMSQESVMTLALIKKAREGDVNAYKALMDSGYGTAVQTIDQKNTNINLDENNLTAEERKQVIDELKNAY